MDLLKLRQSAIRKAMFRGLSFELSQDFASSVIIRILEGKSNRDLNFMLIDYLRSTFGRTDGRFGKEKVELTEYNDEITSSFDTDPNCILVKFCVTHKIGGFDRILFLLYLKYGFTLKEIGELFAMSEANASLRFGKIKKNLNSMEGIYAKKTGNAGQDSGPSQSAK